ncbi:hypothetical protein BIZ42_09595 [Stenotrophomonas sp. LM091]|nr:hypothetical protein BIZ42_09595 [Stenotrophomonas sp. LM091]
MSWNIDELSSRLQRLMAPGLLGNYLSFEVTELVRAPLSADESRVPVNVLSVIVADRRSAGDGVVERLSKKLLKPSGSKFSFGLRRYRVETARLVDALRVFSESGRWQLGGEQVSVGKMVPMPPQFVPADSTQTHPWNAVLKNNFWDGSHVLELFDQDKSDLSSLLDCPAQLTSLASLLQPYVPWSIDLLSDRLGNLIVQIPVTSIVTSVRGSVEGHYSLRVEWRSDVAPRALRATSEIYGDGTVESIDSKLVSNGAAQLELHTRSNRTRHILWDVENDVLMSASAETAFIRGFGPGVSVLQSPRVREFMRRGNEEFILERVPLQASPLAVTQPRNEASLPDPRDRWSSGRALVHTLERMRKSREFVQYGGPAGKGRQDALEDIRYLIQAHGHEGAWIWDPYLSGADLMNTLFFSPHIGSDLRGLTSGQVPPNDKVRNGLKTAGNHSISNSTLGDKNRARDQKKESIRRQRQYRDVQVRDLEASRIHSRSLNLKLEFRIREGNHGWAFHDRFLVFPRLGRPALAWSLGTSVNSLGKEHHIMQKVVDGDLISHAFLNLWNALDSKDSVVWQSE